MTLATHLYISVPVNPQIVFLRARDVIGIPAEHPFSIEPESGLGWRDGEWIRSHPGGFRSALDVSHNHGALLTEDCGEWCDQPCDHHAGKPLAYVDMRLDTAYGYRGPNGESCDDVHREVVGRLGEWLDEQGIPWWSNDEYTGEWREREPGPFVRQPHASECQT